jgi:hypothetical protein
MFRRRYGLASTKARALHVIYVFAGSWRTVCGRSVRFPPWIDKKFWTDNWIERFGVRVCASCRRMQDADTMAAARRKVRS